MQNEKKTNKSRKPLAVFLAVTLLVVSAVGGTLAWLTDSTPAVTNTFTIGNIGVDITETGATVAADGTASKSFKMVPGYVIDKDPVVTVEAGSEDCWVFLAVHESPNLDQYIAYEIDANNWTQLKGKDGKDVEGVYYCKALDITKDRSIKVLGEGSYTDKAGTVAWGVNQVGVKPAVTKADMEAVDGLNADGSENEVKPTLTFNAYAVQYMKDNTTPFTAAEAWELLPIED